MWWKILVFPLVLITILAVFCVAPPQSQLGDVSRLIFLHVPLAWVAILGFLVSMLYSVKYLQRKDLLYDIKASTSARLGFISCLLATISGAIFAKTAWGNYWNWDPRETTVFALLLIYGAYFALRSAISSHQRKATLSSVYSILAFLTVPFLAFVIPRAYKSLHPNASVINQKLKFQMPFEVFACLILSLLSMTLVFGWIYEVEVRISKLKQFKNKQ